jgi:hypothetical protein
MAASRQTWFPLAEGVFDADRDLLLIDSILKQQGSTKVGRHDEKGVISSRKGNCDRQGRNMQQLHLTVRVIEAALCDVVPPGDCGLEVGETAAD